MHCAPRGGGRFYDSWFPAWFTVQNRLVPMWILAIETIANVPFVINFLLLVICSVQSKLETEQLGIIGLQNVLHMIGIQLVISKSHLQVKAIGIVHNLRVAVLLLGMMD